MRLQSLRCQAGAWQQLAHDAASSSRTCSSTLTSRLVSTSCSTLATPEASPSAIDQGSQCLVDASQTKQLSGEHKAAATSWHNTGSASISMAAEPAWGSSMHHARGFAAAATAATPTKKPTQRKGGIADGYWLPHMANPAVPFRKPEDVVRPDSPMLTHYRKNIPGAQLVFRIKNRGDLDSLMDLLKLYQSNLGPRALSAVMTNLYYKQRFSPGPETTAKVHQILDWLLPFLQFQLRFSDPRSNAAILRAWSRMDPLTRDRLPAELAVGLLARAAPAYSPRPEPPTPATPQPKQVPGAFGKPPPQGEEVEYAPHHKLEQTAPRHLALLLYSASNLLPAGSGATNTHVRAAVDAITALSSKKLHQFTPQGVSMAVLGAARLDPTTPATQAFVKTCVEEMQRRAGDVLCERFGAADLGRLLLACGLAKQVHQQLFVKVAAEDVGSMGRWSAGDVERMVEAFAEAGMKHDGLLAAAAAEVLSRGVVAARTAEQRGERRGPFSVEQAQRLVAASTKLGVPQAEIEALIVQCLKEAQGKQQGGEAKEEQQ